MFEPKELLKSIQRVENKTIQSKTELNFLSVSWLELFLQCQRKFYYNYVRQLETRELKISLFIGTHVHKGIELFYFGFPLESILDSVHKSMEMELEHSFINPKDLNNITLTKATVMAILKSYVSFYQSDLTKYKLIQSEKAYGYQLFKQFKTIFAGTLDLILLDKSIKKQILWDHKTSAGDYFVESLLGVLPMDKQINVYPVLYKMCTGKSLYGFVYNVIVKPKIRQKKNETFYDFVTRICNLYLSDPDSYFKRQFNVYDQNNIKTVHKEILTLAKNIQDHFNHDPKHLLDETNWIRSTKRCHDYFSRCPYFHLCNLGETNDRLSIFTQTDERYNLEEIILPTAALPVSNLVSSKSNKFSNNKKQKLFHSISKLLERNK